MKKDQMLLDDPTVLQQVSAQMIQQIDIIVANLRYVIGDYAEDPESWREELEQQDPEFLAQHPTAGLYLSSLVEKFIDPSQWRLRRPTDQTENVRDFLTVADTSELWDEPVNISWVDRHAWDSLILSGLPSIRRDYEPLETTLADTWILECWSDSSDEKIIGWRTVNC